MFYPEFSEYLQQEFAGKGGRPAGENLLDDVILPQFKKIVLGSLEAARGKMAGGSDYYKSFHLFGYDFLIDADFKAWLHEHGFKMHTRDVVKNAERWAAVELMACKPT